MNKFDAFEVIILLCMTVASLGATWLLLGYKCMKDGIPLKHYAIMGIVGTIICLVALAAMVIYI